MNPDSPFVWQTVNAAPFLRGKRSPDYGVAFLNKGKRILGWELGKDGVFAFDVDKAGSDGWTKVPLPLESYRKPFIVYGQNRDIGSFHIMFTYEPDSQPNLVSAFFISKSFDNFQPLTNKPIELPALCSQYLLSRDDEVESEANHMAPTVSSDFQFVDFGCNRVGLVLHKYFEDDPHQGRNTGIVLLLGFQYDIITSANNTLEIHTQFLDPRRLRYQTRQLRRKTYNTETCCKFHTDNFDKNHENHAKELYSQTRQVHLNAAYLL